MDVESSYFSPWFKQSHRCFFFILWYTAKCFMYISKFFTQNIKACAINDWDLIKLKTFFLSTFLSENANEEQWLLVKYDATPLICAKSTQFYPSLPFHHCTNINTVKKDKYHKNKFDFAHQLKESWTPVVCGPHFENHCQLVFFWNHSCLWYPVLPRTELFPSDSSISSLIVAWEDGMLYVVLAPSGPRDMIEVVPSLWE